ncbi:hypothetical protein B484DRAFT_337927 [Ochromonadaceae sp. CCMP2298]|nr:hypothetical protein B484DRAFT_337927 [Ochromonadaceae sp. CCMP2298]
MYDWAQFTAALDTAAVFSWHTGNTSSTRQPSTRDCLLYRDFHDIIKRTAAHYDFDSTQFGCHGVRVGGATHLRAAGADDEFICLMGRWRSLPACLSYQEVSTAAHDRMAALLMTPGVYTTRDLRLQYVLPQLTHGAATHPQHTPPASEMLARPVLPFYRPRAAERAATPAPPPAAILPPVPVQTTTAPHPTPTPSMTHGTEDHTGVFNPAQLQWGGTGPVGDPGFNAQSLAFDTILREETEAESDTDVE